MKVKALSLIKHNGVEYAIGSEFEVSDEEAKVLFSYGVAEASVEPASEPAQTETPVAPQPPVEQPNTTEAGEENGEKGTEGEQGKEEEKKEQVEPASEPQAPQA